MQGSESPGGGCGVGTANPKISFVDGYRAGSRAVRFKAVVGQNAACELNASYDDIPPRLGSTTYFGQRLRLPGPFDPPSGHLTITQHAYEGFRFANFSFGGGYNDGTNFK